MHVLRHYLPIARLRLWRSAGSRLVHNLTNSSNDLENPFFSGSGSLGSGLVGQATQHHVSASTCLARGVGPRARAWKRRRGDSTTHAACSSCASTGTGRAAATMRQPPRTHMAHRPRGAGCWAGILSKRGGRFAVIVDALALRRWPQSSSSPPRRRTCKIEIPWRRTVVMRAWLNEQAAAKALQAGCDVVGCARLGKGAAWLRKAGCPCPRPPPTLPPRTAQRPAARGRKRT